MKVSKKTAAFMLLIILMASFFFACTKKKELTALSSGATITALSSSASSTSATITWTTNVSASSQVFYRTTSGSFSSTVEQDVTTKVKTHSVNVPNLTASTKYFYYVSSKDSSGNTSTTEESLSDFTTTAAGPIISLVTATPSETSAVISWTTDQPASSDIYYGLGTAYGLSSLDATLKTSHSVNLSALSAGTIYHYKVKSTNAGTVSSESSDGTFTTTGTFAWPAPPASGEIYMEADGGVFKSEGDLGYDMGVDTSGGEQTWALEQSGYMKVSYPAGQTWGAVYILRWPPPWNTTDNPNATHMAFDYSGYTKLSVDLKGDIGGETVKIGIKDADDPDTGTETKKTAGPLTTSWVTYTYNLSEFKSANDLKKIYLAIEFVWDGAMPAQTIYFKNVKYHN